MQSALPGRTPLDIRLGLTKAEDVNHKLRWGILGAANICADWVRALANVPGATVVAVAARSQASAQSFADEWGIASAYEGYDKVANDPDVDIVYCGTITPLHKEHVIMCLEAGKHVIVEKPMSISSEESEACVPSPLRRCADPCRSMTWTAAGAGCTRRPRPTAS